MSVRTILTVCAVSSVSTWLAIRSIRAVLTMIDGHSAALGECDRISYHLSILINRYN